MDERQEETKPLLGASGYDRRRATDRDGKFISPEHGSYLAISPSEPHIMNSDQNEDFITSLSINTAMDRPTSVAIHICQEKVIKPYRRLLLVIGWTPVFDDADRLWKRAVNVIHPLLVMCLILLGYVITYSCCFRRDTPGSRKAWIDVEKNGLRNNTVATCSSVAVSQYIIPDILHSAAYLYSFYILRFKQPENLQSLITRSFLQSESSQRGFYSQGRLIRVMRVSVWLSVVWVLLTFSSQIIHVVAMYSTITFQWFHPTYSDVFAKVLLIIFMLISFVVLDMVYVLVVLNYCVQCLLIIFFTEGLAEKIKKKEFELKRAMQEILEVSDHLQVLNYNTGIALSIVVFNFSTMSVLGFVEIFSSHTWYHETLMYVSTGLSVFFWTTITCVPFVQAARVSGACNSLKKVGLEVRAKAFAYSSVDPVELDSFLLFTSSLDMKAKIFLFPIKSSYITLFVVSLAFVVLLIFQLGVVNLKMAF